MRRTIYIEKELDQNKYNAIRTILRQESDIMEKFNLIICPRCKHHTDINFKECNVCRCIDGTIKCCEFIPNEIDPAKGIDEERLEKAVARIANKNRELAKFLRK